MRTLLDRTVLKQLLAEIVTIAVNHDHSQVLANVFQNELNESAIGLGQFSLEMAGASLCAREPRNLLR